MSQSTPILADSNPHLTDETCVAPDVRPCKVAYLMSRFPKLTETFVLFEMLAVGKQGTEVEVFPLLGGASSGKEVAGASLWKKLKDYRASRRQFGPMHPEAEQIVQRAHYFPFLNSHILVSCLLAFVRNPITFLTTVGTIVLENNGNSNFLWGGLAIFPKCVHIARICQRARIDHVHAHFANHPATAAFIIHRFTGLPFSFTAHGSDLHRHKHMLKTKVHHAAFVVAISSYNRRAILEHAGQQYRDKIQNIHCGVDLKVFCSNPSRQDENRTPQFICVGTLHEVKGQAYLMAALRLLSQREVPFHCHFVGDGPDRGRLVELSRENDLQGHVTFHGTKNRAQLVELLQQMDVLVAPSVPTSDGRREGIPVVLMEAMACQVPVIASRISGIPELVNSEQVGRLVEPKDVPALAEEMQKLAVDKEVRGRLGVAARKRIQDEFDLEQNAFQLAELFGDSVRLSEANNLRESQI